MTLSLDLPLDGLTLDEVAELAQKYPEHRFELQEGNLIVMTPPDFEHQQILSRLFEWLLAHGYSGRIFASIGVAAGARTGRVPDLSVLSDVPTGLTGSWQDPGLTLLAVEVESRSTAATDRLVKPEEYAKAGIPNYWRIERPGGESQVHRYVLAGGVYARRAVDTLTDLLGRPVPDLR